jgi:hypothetical protein
MYIERTGNRLVAHDENGSPGMTIFTENNVIGYNLSGDILTVSYPHNTEVYNVRVGNRIR